MVTTPLTSAVIHPFISFLNLLYISKVGYTLPEIHALTHAVSAGFNAAFKILPATANHCQNRLPSIHLYLKVFRVLQFCFATAPLSPLREHLVFSLFYSLIFFLLSVFSLVLLSYHCFTYIFLIPILFELMFFHVSAFSWLFLISLCLSFNIT